MGDVSGASSQASRRAGSGQNWTELLKPENGGPGDCPGREAAVAATAAVTAARLGRRKKKNK